MLKIFMAALAFPLIAQNNDESWKLYDIQGVARVDITVDPGYLAWIYKNVQSDSTHPAVFHFRNNFIDETVDSVGFRIRGNTSRSSQKKSFKISFNEYFPGREFYGVDKLNLNGEHNDPSIIRSKLCFDIYEEIGVHASRASYAEVYINNKYYGLYISVEHIDDEFLDKHFPDASGNLWKCLYPADLTFKGHDPEKYKEGNAYELQTNEEAGDYSKLADLIRILSLTADAYLPDSLERILDVPDVLKYFAINTLTGSWDDYRSLMNNYYLYHNPAEDKLHLIPYDYDNTFGISWFPVDWADADPYEYPKAADGPRPLASELMNNLQYRSLYTHFLKFYTENVFKLLTLSERMDSIMQMIIPYAQADTFRTKDYGFSMGDFAQSYSYSFQKDHVKKGLKQFIDQRINSLPSQLEEINTSPVIYEIDWHPKHPSAEDSIYFYVSAYDYSGVSEINIQLEQEGYPGFIKYPLSFSPVPGTKKVEEADRWTGVIPPLGKGAEALIKINITGNDSVAAQYPRSDYVSIRTPGAVSGLLINEILASNTAINVDEYEEYEDWIEIYNPTENDINLYGLYITDKPDNLTKWQFKEENLVIPSGGFVLVFCDEDEEQGELHCNFKLSANGEFIALTSPDGISVIDSITFGEQKENISFSRFPDGGNTWLFTNTVTPGIPNIITGVKTENASLPGAYALTAYPNPFNPYTTIRFSIASGENNSKGYQKVSLKIYDILGREVSVLIDEEMAPQQKEIELNSENLSSGVYFCILRVLSLNGSLNYQSVHKLVMLK